MRRVPNVLEALLHDLDRDEGARPQRRPFRELARLNDAVLTADQQIQALPDQEKQRLRPVSDALFGLDLAAERTIRRVASQSLPLTHRDPVRQSLRLLRRRLLTGAGGPPESLPPACEPIASSLDALEQSVGRLQDALAAVA